MDQETDNGYYWPAFVDFFSVLFFIALGIGGLMYLQYANQINGLRKYQTLVNEVIHINSKLKNQFSQQQIEIDRDAKDKIKLKGDFFFETDSYSLKDQRARLAIISIGQNIKQILDQDSNKFRYSVIIEGHTDDVGSEPYNNQLSYKRSSSISEIWKKDCGLILPAYEIVVAGYGELRPLWPNNNNRNRELNRRIEISISPKMSEFTRLLQE